jgi:hypothetical protein
VISNLNQAMSGLKTEGEELVLVQDKNSLTDPAKKDQQDGNKSLSSSKKGTDEGERVINPTIDVQVLNKDETLASEGLRHLNDRVSEMVAFRKKELEQGITESHLRTSLAVVKSINDQFNFIWKISEDLIKTLRA